MLNTPTYHHFPPIPSKSKAASKTWTTSILRRFQSIVLGKNQWLSNLKMVPTWESWHAAPSSWRTWSEPSKRQLTSWTNSLSKPLDKEFNSSPLWQDQLNKPLALILGETRGLKSKLTSLRLSAQDNNRIPVRSHAPQQDIEKIYTETMTHEETYLLVCELTPGGVSSEVRPGRGGHLMLTQREASCEISRKTDASTLLHVDLRGESIATILP